MSAAYIIIEGADEAQIISRRDAVQAGYLAKNLRHRGDTEAERLGKPRLNRTRTKAFFGTARGDYDSIKDLGAAHSPWLTVEPNADFARADEWRQDEVDGARA